MSTRTRYSKPVWRTGLALFAAMAVCASSAHAQNLLTNPSAETGDVSGWDIIANGASGWGAFTGPPILGGGIDGGYMFTTDNAWCKRSQTIDLIAKGYSEAALNAAPDIVVSEWFHGYSTDNPPNDVDTAYLRVELRDASHTLIATQYYDSGEFLTTSDWVEKTHTFTGYGTGLRYIYWEDGGLGAESAGPTDGALLDAASLTIDIAPTTAPEITVSPLSLSFGDMDVSGGTTVAQSVTVTNDGDADLEVSFSITGSSIYDFTITNSPATTPIPASGNREVLVAFNPEVTGPRSATLRIWSNDTDEGTTEVTLSGTGTTILAYPECSSIKRAGSNPTNATFVDFTVTFTASVTGVDVTDFSIYTEGPTGASITSVSGSAASYTVTIATGSGDGNLSINLYDDDSITDGTTELGGVGTGDVYEEGQLYAIDKTAPTITILGDNPATTAKDFTYTDAGATASDSLDGNLTSSIVEATTVNTSTVGTYQVTYDVTDAAGNPATQAVRTVNVVDAPTCSSITRADSNPTSAASVDFTVTFSTSVTGVDTADFAANTSGLTGASVSSISGSGTTYTVSVNTGSGDGTLSIDLTDDDTIVEGSIALGGPGAGNGDYTAGESYTVDKTPRTFYVDASYVGAEDGQSATPFDTIAEGIAAALPGRGDTIIVRTGTYTESLTLTDNLIVASESGSYHTHIVDTGKSAIAVTLADDSVLRGFSITNPTATAISLPAALTATVSNCVLHNSDVGLQAAADAMSSCVNNTIVLNTTYGLRGEAGATFSVLKNNCIASNGTGVSADASAITDGAYNNFYNSTTVDYDGPSAAGSDFVADPLFVDAASTNFHLEDGSPCRDAGDPDGAFDDLDATPNDIGADGGPSGVQDTLSPTVSFTATPNSGNAPLTVDFDGSASADEWGIASYSWDYDSSDGIQADATGATPQHEFTVADTYTVTLTVSDNSGLTNTTTRQITVSTPGSDPPTASASANFQAGAVPFEVQFTGAGSDPDGGSVTFSWDFDGDDVEDSSAQSPLYTYPGGTAPGHWVARLTVTDDEASSTEDTVSLTLTQEAVEAATVIDPAAGGSVEVDNVSSSVDGTVVTMPIGATVEPVVATIGHAASTPAPPANGSATEVVELGPTGVSFSQPVAVTLVLAFEPITPANLGVSIYDNGGTQWVTTGISNVTYSVPPEPSVSFDTTNFSFVVATYPAPTEDVNEDTFENAIDVQITINDVLGIPLPAPYRTDVNGDGESNIVDIQLVINAVLGL
jgi:PKD repeat protein